MSQVHWTKVSVDTFGSFGKSNLRLGIVVKTIDSQVLAELPILEVVTLKVRLPVAIGVELIDHHSTVLPAVARELALTITVTIKTARHHLPLTGRFQTPVWATLPCHSTSTGRPTFTETSRLTVHFPSDGKPQEIVLETASCLPRRLSCYHFASVTLELLETLNGHRGRTRLPHLGIKHCVVQVWLRPFQPEILLDERSSRFVRCVD